MILMFEYQLREVFIFNIRHISNKIILIKGIYTKKKEKKKEEEKHTGVDSIRR